MKEQLEHCWLTL